MNSSPNHQGNDTGRSRRARRRRTTKRLAVCAVLTSVGVVIAWLGSLVGLLDLCTPFFAALLLVPIVVEYGKRYAWSVWLATALLSLLLLPNKSPAVVYLIFGYYPILKALLERLRPWACRLLKAVLFVAIDVALVFGSAALFGVEDHLPPWYNAALAIGGLIVLWLVDLALTRLISAYIFKYRTRFSKWMS